MIAVSGPPVTDAAQQDALEPALLLADCDERWAITDALGALDAAEARQGALSPEYEVMRRERRAAARRDAYPRA